MTRSLVEKGTPWRGPSRAPLFPTARSAARASRRAWSSVMVTYALRRGFTRSMRSSTARVTSTGESFLRLIAAASAAADIQQISSFAMVAPLSKTGRSAAAQARVQRVAERIAEQVRAEHGEADGEAGEQHEVRRLLGVLRRRHRKHAAPGRIRLRYAQAEEGQGRL